jgi:transcriptional regulator of arginine metabolism
MKTQRLIAIKKIIQQHKIASQEELLEKLKKKGFDYTQATLSRDLKTLRIIKHPDEGGNYVYALRDAYMASDKRPKAKTSMVLNGFESIAFSNNFAVIKTAISHAAVVATVIDSVNIYEIIGTVAGDDTILVIPREGVKKADIINAFKINFPELKDKL